MPRRKKSATTRTTQTDVVEGPDLAAWGAIQTGGGPDDADDEKNALRP